MPDRSSNEGANEGALEPLPERSDVTSNEPAVAPTLTPSPAPVPDVTVERSSDARQRRVYVVMAVYDPVPRHLKRQVESLLAQTWSNIEILAVIDGRDPEATRLLRSFDDPRIVVAPHDTNVGVYRNFKRGLVYALQRSEAPDDLFAFCDQDDFWEPHKLERQIEEMDRTGSVLVHSDAAFVDDDETVYEKSMFAAEQRSGRYTPENLLLINAVTGMTVVMTREVADRAQHFPEQAGVWFHHDLWVALVAASLGRVGVVDEPLVRYRQHAGNVVGQARIATPGQRRERTDWPVYIRRCEREFLLRNYLVRHLRYVTANNGDEMPVLRAAKTMFGTGLFGLDALVRSLRLWASGERRLGLVAFRMAVGKASIAAKLIRRGGPVGLTGRMRAHMIERTGQMKLGHGTPVTPEHWHSKVDRRMMPIETLQVATNAPRAVNLLIPTLNPDEIFAGIATAIDFAIRFHRAGFHVRIMATDLTMRDHQTSRNFVLSRVEEPERSRLSAVLAVMDARAETRVEVGADDVWIVSAWWSAYVADRAIARTARSNGAATRFVYLIQDFEPGFYPWSEDYANALASYEKPCLPVFNTTILRDFFLDRFPLDREAALSFSPSLHLDRYGMNEFAGPRRRLILYGRPSVGRNMFRIAIHALARWIEEDCVRPSDLEIVSAGEPHAPVDLPNGLTMRSVGKVSWSAYPDLLASADIGLALMLSPHPSHIPLEMAASGVVCVTNSFENKDLGYISPNIVSVEPSLDALIEGLRAAAALSLDRDTRRQGTDFAVELGHSIDEIAAEIAARLGGRVAEAVEPVTVETGDAKAAITQTDDTEVEDAEVVSVDARRVDGEFAGTRSAERT